MFTEATPELFLNAYMQGVFPMAESESDAHYNFYRPDMRGQLSINDLHIPKKLLKTIKSKPYDIKINTENKDQYTALGNPYQTTDFVFFDNGNYTSDYFCEIELKKGWQEISSTPYKDVTWVLIRYLTSKGYRKDYNGVKRLTPLDVKNIENGTPNYLQVSNSLMNRLYQLMFEVDGYLSGASANGNSLAQRLVYWKASKEIGQQNVWFGHGTGDVKAAFQNHYKNNEDLSKRYQLRSHNQYLSIFIALGAVGVFVFIITLIIPLQFALRKRNYLYIVFSCIALMSFLSEDTLETQDGVFFFAFFNALLLFQTPKVFLRKYV